MKIVTLERKNQVSNEIGKSACIREDEIRKAPS